jgi:hypothetical protein
MKLKEIWNWLVKANPKQKAEKREIDSDDPHMMIKHRTQKFGLRSYGKHNNRRRTKGRNIQYVNIGSSSKPIYHGAN